MKLYDAIWAPSPRRVRFFLAEKGIEIDRVMIDLRANEQLSPAYLAINPRGAVPALVLDDGEVIDESEAICRFFEALHPDPPLFGSTPLEIARIDAWTRRIDADGYQAVVAVFRNASPSLADRALSGKWPPIGQIAALADRGRIMWDLFVDVLDARLADRTWIASDDFSYADIVAFVTMDFARAARLPAARERPAITRWQEAVALRPAAAA